MSSVKTLVKVVIGMGKGAESKVMTKAQNAYLSL